VKLTGIAHKCGVFGQIYIANAYDYYLYFIIVYQYINYSICTDPEGYDHRISINSSTILKCIAIAKTSLKMDYHIDTDTLRSHKSLM
jgi:hypothetical protein